MKVSHYMVTNKMEITNKQGIVSEIQRVINTNSEKIKKTIQEIEKSDDTKVIKKIDYYNKAISKYYNNTLALHNSITTYHGKLECLDNIKETLNKVHKVKKSSPVKKSEVIRCLKIIQEFYNSFVIEFKKSIYLTGEISNLIKINKELQTINNNIRTFNNLTQFTTRLVDFKNQQQLFLDIINKIEIKEITGRETEIIKNILTQTTIFFSEFERILPESFPEYKKYKTKFVRILRLKQRIQKRSLQPIIISRYIRYMRQH